MTMKYSRCRVCRWLGINNLVARASTHNKRGTTGEFALKLFKYKTFCDIISIFPDIAPFQMSLIDLPDSVGSEVLRNLPSRKIAMFMLVSTKVQVYATWATNSLLLENFMVKKEGEKTRDVLFAMHLEDKRQLPPSAKTQVYSCGRNAERQLGWWDDEVDDDQEEYGKQAWPSKVILEKTNVRQIACGAMHTILLGDDGCAFSFGQGIFGQLGIVKQSEDGIIRPSSILAKPTKVDALQEHKITYVSAGAAHTVFVDKTGSVYTCGKGTAGQLGYEPDALYTVGGVVIHKIQEVPLRVEGDLLGKRVVQAEAGQFHSVALTSNGDVFTWGKAPDINGRSNSMDICHYIPRRVRGFQEHFATCVAAGSNHTVIVTAEGKLYTSFHCTIDTSLVRKPAYLCRNLHCKQEKDTIAHEATDLCGKVEHVSAGHLSTLVVTKTNILIQFKDTSKSMYAPRCSVTSTSCGHSHAALVSGKVLTWGVGTSGELGHGVIRRPPQHNLPDPRPVNSLPERAMVLDVACGFRHTAFLVRDDKNGRLT